MAFGERMVPARPATETALHELEARLFRLIQETNDRLANLEVRLAALHLGSTCHPEWVSPSKGYGARARRASIVEAVLAMAGDKGLTLTELASFLHLPKERHDTLLADLSYLIDGDRAERMPTRAKKWRWRSQTQ